MTGFLLPLGHPVVLYWRLLRKHHPQIYYLSALPLDHRQPPERRGFQYLKQRMVILQLPLDQLEVTLSLALLFSPLSCLAPTGQQFSIQAFPPSAQDLQPQVGEAALLLHQSNQLQLHALFQQGPPLLLKLVHLHQPKLAHLLL